MKVVIEERPEGGETEVVIRCREVDAEVRSLLQFLEKPEQVLLGERQDQLHLLDPRDIFYAEAVEGKVFIYASTAVFETRKRLYELEELLEPHHFFRAAKSLILNINKIESVRPLFDGRFEALLKNGEKVYISRQYVSVLKKRLGL